MEVYYFITSIFYKFYSLEDCKERNVEPEQPYKGTFNVRISPELHRNIAVYAIEHGKSLNAAVEEAIGNMVRA